MGFDSQTRDVSVPTAFKADLAPTQYLDGPLGEHFAYRRLGTPGAAPPLVLLLRLRGTIDHWDPALLDALSADREVIVFDNRGLNESTGAPATSVPELVDGAIAFVHALGLRSIDLLGWSLGGIVAQGVALTEPHLVRRLIVAGSTPGGVPDAPRLSERVLGIVAKPDNDAEDFLYLFFPETPAGRAAGEASLTRLATRLNASQAALSPEALKGQLTAIATFPGWWERLDELAIPVLLANGTQDVMVDAIATYAAARRLTNARTVLWSDAGHGFLFQHVDEFAREVAWFLAADLP
jgi:pimeloyl-ACP methyl ester carboxylesterase